MAPRLTLVIPKLLPYWHEANGPNPLQEAKLTSLKLLLSRGRMVEKPQVGFEKNIYNFFNPAVPPEIPAGALTAHAYNLVGKHPWWLRADPVMLQPDHSSVIMLGNYPLQLRNMEVSHYIAELAPLFKEHDISIHAPRSCQWVLNVPSDPQLLTQPLLEVVGKNLNEFLSRREGFKVWQKLLTEIQMKLHQSKTNNQRVTAGKDIVNSLWFWGAGTLPKPTESNLQAVWSDDPLVIGLSKLNNVPAHPMPSSLFACLNHCKEGHYLIALTSLRNQFTHGKIDEWKNALHSLEEVWFIPLLNYLKSGDFSEVEIDTCDGRSFVISRKTVKQWWRRTKDLTNFTTGYFAA